MELTMESKMLQSPYAEKPLNIAHECLRRHSDSENAGKIAMIFVAADLSCKEFTYAELDTLSARFAASFMQRGLAQGDRILLRLPNTHIFPAAFFGALRAGMIPVPSSPMLTAPEFGYLVSDSGAQAIVTDAHLMAPLRANEEIRGLKAIYVDGATESGEIAVGAELAATPPWQGMFASRGATPAYLVYTSGTTGYPKGVLHAHQALLGRLPAATQWFPFADAGFERILHSGKFNWTYVLGTGMMDPLYHGKTVVVYEGENSPERWVEIIRRYACNIFIGVPTIFRQILQKTAVTGADLPSLRHAMCAGEHLTDEVLSEWVGRFSFPIYEGLGMSECSYYISQRRGEPGKTNSAGKIQDGHIVALLDENLRSVATGDEGMLCIRRDDPGLFLEYWSGDRGAQAEGSVSSAREANERQFRDGWFLTGDYATLDADGYVHFLGRRDDIIKSFGYRVSPFEIERVYRDHPAIEDLAVFGEKLSEEKTLIALCVIMRAGHEFNEAELIAWGKARLASYKLPKKVHQLQKFPRSANGKVLRSQLAKLVGG